MKILIIGLGSLGSELARKLVETDTEVHGIDLNPSRLRKNNFLQKTFQLDACLREELIKLQPDQYNRILVCIGSKYEKCNLITSLLLAELTKTEIIVEYLSEIQKESLQGLASIKFIKPFKSDIDSLINSILE